MISFFKIANIIPEEKRVLLCTRRDREILSDEQHVANCLADSSLNEKLNEYLKFIWRNVIFNASHCYDEHGKLLDNKEMGDFVDLEAEE